MKRPLSRRECQIYHLIGEGLPHKEIAYRLGINDKTVSCHLVNLTRKLCLPDTSAAIRHAGVARAGAEWARLADEEGAYRLAKRIRESYGFEDIRLAQVLAGLEGAEHTR